MFKQIIIMVIFIFISYIVTEKILKYDIIYFKTGIIKYPLKYRIKNAKICTIEDIKNKNNLIFYTKEKINQYNYIYDITSDSYYLIEPKYYYYIRDSTKTIINFKENFSIFNLNLIK